LFITHDSGEAACCAATPRTDFYRLEKDQLAKLRPVAGAKESWIKENLAERVFVVLEASECCGWLDRARASQEFGRAEEGGPLAWDQDAPMVKEIKQRSGQLPIGGGGPAKMSELVYGYNDSWVVGYHLSGENKIDAIYIGPAVLWSSRPGSYTDKIVESSFPIAGTQTVGGIHLKYPEFGADWEALNTDLRTTLAKLTENLKTALRDNGQRDSFPAIINRLNLSPGSEAASLSNIFGVYEAKQAGIVSVKILAQETGPMYAHPAEVLEKTFVYQKNRPVALANLFKPGSDYLGRLSAGARMALAVYPEGTISEAGLLPTPQNFEQFVLTDEGLIVIFRVYQVGARPLGAPMVLVPYGYLQNLIEPKGPLGVYLTDLTTAQAAPRLYVDQ
jgi:hypothetical protein